MNDRKKEPHFSPTIGVSSLLTIFAVLCLTVFALLALSTVSADTRLSQASAQAVSDYYDADCTAQEIFARIRLGEEPDRLPLDEVTRLPGKTIYAYTVAVSDSQNLKVQIEQQANNYHILQWQTVPSQTWEIDETIDVWDGLSQ